MVIIQLSMFDGKVCYECQQWKSMTEYYSHDALCKICKRAKRKQRYYANADKERQMAKEYMQNRRQTHPDAVRAAMRRSWVKHREKRTAELRERYAKNRVERRLKAAEQYAANPQPTRDQASAWRRANPDKRRVQHHQRRARELAGGTYTADQWDTLCAWFEHVCVACGSTEKLTVDHVLPLIKGGSNTIGNLQPLCRTCNFRKHDKNIDYRDPDRLKAFLEHIQC